MPRSQTPVVSYVLAIAYPRLLPSGACTLSAFPSPHSLRDIFLTTTLHISGLHHAACLLVLFSFVRPWLGVHVDVTSDLLARLSSGGTCAWYGAHPLGNSNQFHGISPNAKVSGFPWHEHADYR